MEVITLLLNGGSYQCYYCWVRCGKRESEGMVSASFQELNTTHPPRQNPKLPHKPCLVYPHSHPRAVARYCFGNWIPLRIWAPCFPDSPCAWTAHTDLCVISEGCGSSSVHPWRLRTLTQEAATSEIHLFTHYACIVWQSHSGCCRKGQGVRDKTDRKPFPTLLIGIKNRNQNQKWFNLSEVCAEESRGVCGGEDSWFGKWMEVWFEMTCWHFQVPFLTAHTWAHMSICLHLPSIQWN